MTKQEMRSLLFEKYRTLLLSRSQAAEALNISVATLDRWKKQGMYLEYKKRGTAKNSTVAYPLDTIINYLINNNNKVF